MTGPAAADPVRTCPSTTVENATVFLGMVTPGGQVAYFTPSMPAAPETVAAVTGGMDRPESAYRFAGPCVTDRCGFWTGSHCGLGERLATSFAEVTAGAGTTAGPAPETLPKCAIRGSCRWFAEQGPAACRACRYVVTDTRLEDAS